jgi:ATP-dependent DNA ligase
MEFPMTILCRAVFSIAIAATSFGTFAQTDAEHAQHHPSAPTQKAAKTAVATSKPSAKEAVTAMDSKIKVMREMHEKLVAAKTPEERKALMAEHMKAMQDGMSMMGSMDAMSGMKDMGGAASGVKNEKGMSMNMMDHHEMMEKRMEMMSAMMQMMMDRLPPPSAQ